MKHSSLQAIRLQPLPDDDVLSVLTELDEPLPPEDATRGEIARQAEGSPRNALLMTRYGGLELARALDELIEAPQMDMAAAYQLATAVSARDADIQFSILNQTMLERIADRARTAGLGGDNQAAARLSELWRQARETIQATSTYNLDKKQHVVGLVTRLRQGMRQ